MSMQYILRVVCAIMCICIYVTTKTTLVTVELSTYAKSGRAFQDTAGWLTLFNFRDGGR